MVLSVLCIALQYRTYFLAGIGGMPFVKHVHDGHHFHCAAVTVFRIHVILYGYKPYPERRKDIIHILPDFDVVPAETGKVFDDDGIDDARFCVVQKPLHFGALECSSRYAVVDIFAVDFKAMFFGILSEHRPLVVDGYRFALTFVFLRKPVIKTCYVVLLFHTSPRCFIGLIHRKPFHRPLEIFAAAEIPADII